MKFEQVACTVENYRAWQSFPLSLPKRTCASSVGINVYWIKNFLFLLACSLFLWLQSSWDFHFETWIRAGVLVSISCQDWLLFSSRDYSANLLLNISLSSPSECKVWLKDIVKSTFFTRQFDFFLLSCANIFIATRANAVFGGTRTKP